MFSDGSYDQVLTEDEIRNTKKTLDNIKSEREYQKLLKEQNTVKTDYAAELFDPFDDIVYEGKIKIDLMYFNQFLQKLDETIDRETLQETFTSLYKDVYKIYEHVNIRPEIYGGHHNVGLNILEDSNEEAHLKMSKVIAEYLKYNYYKLSETEKKEKYYETVCEESKDMIKEGVSPAESITFNIKAAVMEGLVRNIVFPFSAWSRITHLSESVDYGKVFDQDTLISLKESFENKVKNISKIIAACV